MQKNIILNKFTYRRDGNEAYSLYMNGKYTGSFIMLSLDFPSNSRMKWYCWFFKAKGINFDDNEGYDTAWEAKHALVELHAKHLGL